MTTEEAIKFAVYAKSFTDIPEVKEFYALVETALREQEEREKPQPLTLEIQNLDLRQIVLRALMSLEDQYTQTHSLMTVNVADYICQSIEKSIDKNERRWIPVTERLPKCGERVLATDGGFVGEFYINKRGQWQRYNVNDSSLLMALDILSWMPLPQPPKEDA